MQQESRRELVDRFLRYMGESRSDPVALALANDLVAVAVRTIWLAHPFTDFVLAVDPTITLVAGQAFYTLPTSFGRIAKKDGCLRNLTTGGKLFPITPINLEERHPEVGSVMDTGRNSPTHYTLSGRVGVTSQVLSTGEALEVVSTDAADLDVVLEIEGLYSDGEWRTLQVTLNGTTAVPLNTWLYVQTVGKAATVALTTPLTSSRGDVVVRRVAGATTIVRLLPVEASRELMQLRFWPTPDAAATIAVPTLRLPRRIYQDADPLPQMWGDAIFEDMQIEWRKQGGELYDSEAAALPRPKLLQLIGWDNELKPAARPWKRAFGVGR